MGTAIDYAGIRSAIKSILEGDSRTNTARVYVEEEPQFGLPDSTYAIAVFTDGRTAPPRDQTMGMGKQTSYNIRNTLWVLAFSIESYNKACELRDSLLGNVELVLQENRTLNNQVTTSWLEGGAFISARGANNEGFTAAGELVLISDARVIST